MATEYGRKNGSYSTAVIGRWELVRQDIAGNYSVIRSHLYFYYGGSTSVGSSSSSFGTMGVTLYSGSYRFYPGETHLGSTDFTVYHNADGTFPATNIGFWAQSYHISSGEVWGTIGYRAVPDIPRQANVTGYNDFNDEQNPTITYNNPGGFRINARLEFGGTNIRRDNISNTGSYTFNLTDGERKLLRQKCTGNSMTVRGVIATCIGGTTENYWSYWDRTMTIVNGNPTFNNFEFEDVNPTTIALTGNNQNIIKGYSNVQATIPVASKAIAKKETTMSKYRFTCGDKADDKSYSDTADVNLTINGVPNGTFTVYATDKRNNSTPVQKLANQVIDYSPLTKISIDAYRSGGVSEEVILQLEGTINIVNFGKKTNAIKTAKLKFRVANTSEWNAEQDIVLTVADGKFSYNGAITGDLESKGFNISNSYEVEVIVTDELSSVTFTDTFGSGTPNLAYHKNGISVMGKYDVEVGGAFQIKGKNPFKIRSATAYLTSDRGDTATKNIQFHQIAGNTDLLTLQNGGIRIGKGAGYVLVSGQCFLASGTNNSYLWTSILKNSTEVSVAIDNYNTYFASTTHSPRIIGVSEGDIIYLHRIDNSTGNVRSQGNTYLTVTVLEWSD